MAARNNPLINWLNLSFDSFNLLHRWTGRIVALEALAHTFAYIASVVHAGGWAAAAKSLSEGGFIMYGLIVSYFN